MYNSSIIINSFVFSGNYVQQQRTLEQLVVELLKPLDSMLTAIRLTLELVLHYLTNQMKVKAAIC